MLVPSFRRFMSGESAQIDTEIIAHQRMI